MRPIDTPSSDTGPRILHLMHRREFLVLGSAAAVGVAASPLSAKVRAVWPDSGTAQLAFGYMEKPASGTSAMHPPMAADVLTAGDPRFISAGARVGVLGFWRAERNRATPISVALGAWYDVPGTGRAPVVAWTYTADSHGIFPGGRSPFVVPVDVTRALELSVECADPASRPRPGVVSSARQWDALSQGVVPVPALSTYEQLSKSGQVASLALDYGRGMKLRPGLYIVAVQPKPRSEAAPDWSSLTLADLSKPESLDPRGSGPLTESHLLGSGTPGFDYLLLDVDLAPAAVPEKTR